MLTTKFKHKDGSPWLISELAAELGRQGHEVTVLNVEWSGDPVATTPGEFNVTLKNFSSVRVGRGKISLALRWMFSSFKAVPSLLADLFRGSRYDLLICFSPCSALSVAIVAAKLICKRSFLIYWDFFPIHNYEISEKLPSFALPLLKFLERCLIGCFSRVGCMSEKSILYFENYFGRMAGVHVSHLPIWTSFLRSEPNSRATVRERLGIDNESLVLVFGGQLSAGRGIEHICRAAIMAWEADRRIVLLICGSGDRLGQVREFEKLNPRAIKYGGSLSREEYLEVLGAADVGIVSTTGSTSSPSFPSKSLDYMASRLPILATVEFSSEFGAIVEGFDMGIACIAADVSDMAGAMGRIFSSRESMIKMGTNAQKYLRIHHSVEQVTRLITD
ncbi:glycosyltransferase family 4 protein [Variovorax sp. PDC80]|uniref:glycosyltransferase family 4 protein n=1 Tax=Variovorax sp. PDC80 TaxID=1882827 RepID=UPI0015A52147|nr:glycosyltransferase family 4 protein [Variovorax sp. PDC80]